MYLVIAEKPSVARSIAEVLGADKRKDGYLEGNDCIVSWCLGHLAGFAYPERYDDRYKNWNFEDLPIIPQQWKVEVASDKKDQFYVLKKLLNQPGIDYVVNACDAGREGELIFKHVYDLSRSRLPMKRLWISSLEDAAIREGFNHLKTAEECRNLSNAAVCRSQADWLIGMNATRAFTSKYYKKLTVGRVQTPTLAMLVERDEQIRNFVKEKYFNIELDCDGMQAVREKFFDEAEADQLLKRCDGMDAVVVAVNLKDKTLKPPKLYDLTSLQRDANRIYGMTAKQTLDAAQSLYEAKLITYPRTDSQFLTEDMEGTARNVIRQIHELYQVLGPFETPKKPDIKRVMNNKKVSDHHAIIPTMEIADSKVRDLKEADEKILFMIAIRLLAATDEDHIFTEIHADVSCGDETFTAKGKSIKQYGWKLYDECFKNKDRLAMQDIDEVGKESLPQLEEGQLFRRVSAEKTEHYTSPPKAFNEDLLLHAMETAGNKEFDDETEKKGLGTPATRAGIIEKLVHDKYISRKGKNLVSTEDGKALVSVMPDCLKSASMTAEWENQLLQMEKGQMDPEMFMRGITNLVSMMLNDLEVLPAEEFGRFSDRKPIGKCPACGSPVYEGKKNFYCANKECNFSLWKENRYLESMKKSIDADMAMKLLADGRVRVKDLYSYKKDMYFEADLLAEYKDGKTMFSLEFPKRNVTKKRK
ncbi:MAG: DNA topoisomerase 3 [Dorea sp.]|nr:DNA topoisomerase 3 [Dorea sp.]